MYFIDTHAHLNFKEFKDDYAQVIDRARLAGVKKIIIPGTDPDNTIEAVEIANQFENVHASLGAHPLHLKGGFSLEVDDGMPPSLFFESYNGAYSKYCSIRDFQSIASLKEVAAIGEIGLDYQKNTSRSIVAREIQIAALRAIIRATKKLVKPYIFHCRPSENSDLALKDLYSILSAEFGETDNSLKGVVHCFVGNYDWFNKFYRLGFLVSFTGLISRTIDFDKTIERIPLEGMMIETDCPYLVPNNVNRKRSEPIDVIKVAKKIAEIKKLSLEKVARVTSSRAEELFRI